MQHRGKDHKHVHNDMHETEAKNSAHDLSSKQYLGGPFVKTTDKIEEHDAHKGHHIEDFLKRFWICTAISLPVLLLSHMIQQWVGIKLDFEGDKYVLLLLGSFIYFYGGMPFLRGLFNELKRAEPGMMTLIAVAISAAYVYSVAIVFGLPGMDFFWELATLIDIMLLGHWLEIRSGMAASRALESLVALLPSVVHLEKNGKVVDTTLQDLERNDIVHIRPGEKIPADGRIIEGDSYINESMLTGESLPIKKSVNDNLIGGAINGDGFLKIRVTGTGKESYLHKIVSMVQTAQGVKSQTQNLANKVARWLTLFSLSVGLMTFIVWLVNGSSLSFALERMVTVMVTSCPHALGVAIPLVVSVSTSLAATHGLLIRNRTAFENARNITTVIFDKTGTLTKGSHEVQQILSLDSQYTSDEILQYAASVQQYSEHYIARGILNKLKQKQLPLLPSGTFYYMQGIGVSATVNDKKVVIAGPNYFRERQINIPNVPESINRSIYTVSFLLIDDYPVGLITLADSIRDTAVQAIADLKKMQIKSYLLTGDNENIAAAVAAELNMDGYMANVLPHEKQQKVQQFQKSGEVIAMTGDGVNDAPALAIADIGIAIGSGTDVAAETADIILVNSDPGDVVNMIAFGKATYSKMIQNLVWAVGYNVIAIPLAAGVLYPAFILSPAMGAVLMSISTIIVAINARLLRVKK